MAIHHVQLIWGRDHCVTPACSCGWRGATKWPTKNYDSAANSLLALAECNKHIEDTVVTFDIAFGRKFIAQPAPVREHESKLWYVCVDKDGLAPISTYKAATNFAMDRVAANGGVYNVLELVGKASPAKLATYTEIK